MMNTSLPLALQYLVKYNSNKDLARWFHSQANVAHMHGLGHYWVSRHKLVFTKMSASSTLALGQALFCMCFIVLLQVLQQHSSTLQQ